MDPETPEARRERLREQASRGGKASGEARRRKREARLVEEASSLSGLVDGNALSDPRTQDPATLEAVADASRRTLEGIRDDTKALRSDRINAAKALMAQASSASGGGTDAVALWLARRQAIEALPPADALGWLLGELQEEAQGIEEASSAVA